VFGNEAILAALGLLLRNPGEMNDILKAGMWKRLPMLLPDYWQSCSQFRIEN
jgi:hypothetical protein